MCGDPSGPSVASMLNQANLQRELLQQRQGNLFGEAIPAEEKIAQEGIPGFGAMMDTSEGATARSFAPAEGQLSRSLAQAGISSNDPRAISARTQLESNKGRAFDDTMFRNLMAQFAAKSGAIQNLLSLGQSQDPLQALQLILSSQIQRGG